VVNMPLVI